MLCHFIEQNNLGVADTDTAAKASCESAVGRALQQFLFLHNNIGSLLVNNSSIINYNFVLKYLQSLVPTKFHDVGVKLKSTTVDELTSFLDFIERQTKLNKRCWPGSFFKPLQSDKSKIVVQTIVDLEEAIVDIAFKTRQRINIQATITVVRIASKSGKTAPSIVNI